jgi:hypothetical protein
MKFSFLATTAIATTALCGVASAAPITFYYSGAITNVSGTPGTFSVGQSVSGSYTFDTSTPATIAASNLSLYLVAATGTLNIAGLSGSTQSYQNSFFVVNNTAPGGGQDRLAFGSLVGTLSGQISVSNTLTPVMLALQNVTIDLRDASGTALTNTDLPLTVPDLSSFSSRTGTAMFYEVFGPDQGQFGNVQFSLDTLTASPSAGVPTPGALALLGFGLLGLGGLRRKKAA